MNKTSSTRVMRIRVRFEEVHTERGFVQGPSFHCERCTCGRIPLNSARGVLEKLNTSNTQSLSQSAVRSKHGTVPWFSDCSGRAGRSVRAFFARVSLVTTRLSTMVCVRRIRVNFPGECTGENCISIWRLSQMVRMKEGAGCGQHRGPTRRQ